MLRLLDHQIVGPDGALLGNVDDLEMISDDTGWLVTGLMVGPAALSQRLPGLLGRWVYAVWRRLHPSSDPTPVVLPLAHVTSIGSVIEVNLAAAQALSSTFGLELWLREHVISRLPGATGDAEQLATGKQPPSVAETVAGVLPLPVRAPLEGARGLSSLIGRTVLAPDGTFVGRVSEVRCVSRPPGHRLDALRARWVVYTRHLAGSELGYSTDRTQGPALVRRLVRIWQRHDRVVAIEHVIGLETTHGALRLDQAAAPRHPHDLSEDPGAGDARHPPL
ncbi:hypothetical protein LJR027_002060 [Terrabacter sp. LjRoot27]|uniref:hypothetical protein n=1 Tax=Terrabacter sp. LjRoot27 TaxID=3342306 RepID=UPI003ECD5928